MIYNVTQLNQNIKENPKNFILDCEKTYLQRAQEIAQIIKENVEKTPIILVSGPSGSGKTTTALTIENILDNSGFETHTLSLDNYFKPILENDKILLEQGKLDLESPNRVDDELLNEHLNKLIKCEQIEIPKYDFTLANRVKSGIRLKRNHNEPVILEGIHSLNPDVIKIPDENTLKIYVSVRTRMKHEENVLHPSYIRLLRRMIRDNLYRGRSIQETIKMFKSVEVGAKKYIMPYKYRSDIDVDTFVPYELPVYKSFLLEKLKELKDSSMAKTIDILESVADLDESLVPKNSLIREFIGNGHFDY